MQIKRLTVILLSLVIGVAITAFFIYAYIPLPVAIPVFNVEHIGFGTTPEKFAYSNVLLLVLSLAGIAFIWLDYFLDTKFLKN